jgi:hypothetical protein
MEARLHEGRGQIDSAVRDLIPHIFYNGLASNDEAVRLLKDILKRNYSDEEVIAEMNLALQRIEFKRKGSPPTTVFFGVTVSFDEDVNDLQEARKILRSNPVVVPFLGEDEK